MLLLALVVTILSLIGQSSGEARDAPDVGEAKDAGPARDVEDVQDAGDARDVVISDVLVEAGAVQYVGSNYVHVGFILAGMRGSSLTKRPIIAKLEELVQSLLRHSRGTRAHFVVFTDLESRPHISAVFRSLPFPSSQFTTNVSGMK